MLPPALLIDQELPPVLLLDQGLFPVLLVELDIKLEDSLLLQPDLQPEKSASNEKSIVFTLFPQEYFK